MQSISMIILVLFLSVLSARANLKFLDDPDVIQPEAEGSGLETLNNANNLAAGSGSGKLPASAGAPPPSKLEKLKPQSPNFNFNLTTQLPSSSSKISMLDTIPPVCNTYAGQGDKAECKASMTAFSITFDDCGDSWTVCRCSDATMEISLIQERFSRVPVGLRRYVNTVFVMNDASPHAYTLTNGDIHLFGECQMETWLHETMHAFDYASGTPASGTPEWLDALAKDTCAPDNYALNNRIEDFAQIAVLKIYQLAHNGELPPDFEPGCMQAQLDFFDDIPLFDTETMFGNTCDINEEFDWDLNLGAKKTKAPSTLLAKKVMPLPGYDDAPVINVGSPTSDSDSDAEAGGKATPSRMITRPHPAPSGSAAQGKKSVYDNAAPAPASSVMSRWMVVLPVVVAGLVMV